MEKALRIAKVIDAEDVGTEEVGIGSTVRLKDLNGGDELQYTIVGSMESDPRANKISDESPVGRAMLGQRVGNIVEILVPAGTLKYQIIDIMRSDF